MSEAVQPGAPRFPVVFVVGPARCGSTLLGRLLDGNPAVVGVGEMMRMEAALRRALPCGCGAAVEACPFWARHLPPLRAETGLRYRRYTVDLYRRIAAAESRALVVDLSKTRVCRWQAWRPARGEGYLVLVRDLRGVVASAVRRGEDLRRLLRKQEKWTRRFQRLHRRRA